MMNLRASNVKILDQEQGKESQIDRDLCHQSQGWSLLLDSPKRETVPLPLLLPTAAPEESQWGHGYSQAQWREASGIHLERRFGTW